MLLVILFVIFLTTTDVYSAMTEKQLNATKKLVKNTCQNRAKASAAEIDAMQKGNFDTSESANCYLHCIMNTYKLLKSDGTFDWEAGIKVLEINAPESISKPGSISVENCKDAIKTPGDLCKSSMEIGRCLYNDNPANYFLP